MRQDACTAMDHHLDIYTIEWTDDVITHVCSFPPRRNISEGTTCHAILSPNFETMWAWDLIF
jgi:hypothetical protein